MDALLSNVLSIATLVFAVSSMLTVGFRYTIQEIIAPLHNARAFVGYENKLYEQVSFVSSLEYLQNFEDTETYRLIFDAGLKSKGPYLIEVVV